MRIIIWDIKRFSHSKQAEAMNKSIDNHFSINATFALWVLFSVNQHDWQRSLCYFTEMKYDRWLFASVSELHRLVHNQIPAKFHLLKFARNFLRIVTPKKWRRMILVPASQICKKYGDLAMIVWWWKSIIVRLSAHPCSPLLDWNYH